MTNTAEIAIQHRFSQRKMQELATIVCNKILKAKDDNGYFTTPFKHLVVDEFLPDDLAQSCLKSFPLPNDDIWDRANDHDIEVKLRSTWKSEFDIPEGIVDTVRLFNSSIFLTTLSNVFGIEKLIPDPYFTGGGLNVTMPGGLLDIHVDGNYHDATGLNRRMNVILYLNTNWQKDWGGEFGIYDEVGENCVKKIPPLFNRFIAFDTHDKSFHGLPDPLNFPEGEYRKSIILYYYTKAPRESVNNLIERPHSALWKKRGLKDKNNKILREFK